jgi:DNA-binding response OmpR family regulator
VKILLVEDDEPLAEVLTKALKSQHYLVDPATDGQAGWELVEAFEYDLILLDLMLPKLDGISFCKKLRHKGDHTPVLLLTGQDSITNKTIGLDAGADDYIVKPFDVQELLARIRALLRRGSSIALPILEWENLCLDPGKCEVTYDGRPLRLAAKEYALIELFLRNTQRIFSQSALLDHLWSFDEPPSENTVRAHIKSLRQKLKKAGAPADFIETVYGLGYRLKSRQSQVLGALAKRGVSVSTEGKGCAQAGLLGTVQHSRDKSGLNPAEVGTNANNCRLTKANASLQRSQILSPLQEAETPGTLIPTSFSAGATQKTPTSITPEAMNEIWERVKGKYSDRIGVLEKAARVWREDTLSEELRQQALLEAHTLAGSLGSFGLEEASRLSRELEQVFKAGEQLTQSQKDHLSGRLVELRQALEQPLGVSELVETWPATSLQRPRSVKQQSRLLVVDDDEALALAMIAEAKAWGMQAEIATNLSKARELLDSAQPDVVLLDLNFPDSAENGFDLLTELTTELPHLPVLVYTAQESFSDRVNAARLGGRSFLQKPMPPIQVMKAIAKVLQQSSTPEAKLLIVDDDRQLLDYLRTLLEPWGFSLTLLDNPQQFWETLEQTTPDLLILDVAMPELSGIDLCQVVRSDPHWSELPVLFLSARTDAETVHRVFTAGADDYVNKPIVGPELVARVLNRLERTQIQQKLQKLGG